MNIILIVSDSLRADHVRVYQELWREQNPNGGPPVTPYFRMHTPHLDRLAAEGALPKVRSSSVLTPAPMRQYPTATSC